MGDDTSDMKKRIKIYLNIFLVSLGSNGEAVKNFYRRLRSEKRNLFLRMRIIFQKYHISDPNQLYWIDPNLIVYHTNYVKGNKSEFKDRVFDMIRDKGRVYGGDWDLSTYKFTDLDVYKAFQQRMLHGKNWEETSFYKNELAQIEDGQTIWGCQNREQWNERCRSLDSLIQSIRENGYLLSHKFSSAQDNSRLFLNKEMFEEVTVNIGRNGQYLFQNGRHRLSIAKILGLDKIPVRVLVRHKGWQELREKLISMTKQNRGATESSGMLYQPAIHPDFSDIPSAHLCEDRFFAIKKNLKTNSGSVLDLGANLAYFCHKFEDLGFDCLAIEIDPEIAEVADRIRVAQGKSFQILTGNLFEPKIENKLGQMDFDIVLALNIFHHFLKTESAFNQFRQWLKKLRSKSMFFEPHLHNEEQMQGSYVNFKEEEFIDFIIANTAFKHLELLHETTDGRHIYRLY